LLLGGRQIVNNPRISQQKRPLQTEQDRERENMLMDLFGPEPPSPSGLLRGAETTSINTELAPKSSHLLPTFAIPKKPLPNNAASGAQPIANQITNEDLRSFAEQRMVRQSGGHHFKAPATKDKYHKSDSPRTSCAKSVNSGTGKFSLNLIRFSIPNF
jgi:hypothetical protein